jgi:hypothetical protein
LRPWREVENGFEQAGWSNGRFLVDVRGTSRFPTWIAFVPGVVAAHVAEKPDSFECVDCPPPAVVNQLREEYDILPLSPVSIAFRDGVPSTTFFRGRGAVVERVNANGHAVSLFNGKSALREADINALRVSPDERDLVFTLETVLKSPIPLPTMHTEIYLLDLTTHHRQRVAGGDARVIRGVSWSADSKRSYYARTSGESGPGRDHGVYVVRVDSN